MSQPFSQSSQLSAKLDFLEAVRQSQVVPLSDDSEEEIIICDLETLDKFYGIILHLIFHYNIHLDKKNIRKKTNRIRSDQKTRRKIDSDRIRVCGSLSE